ncbi:MAG: M6 family metalloprotease domain-containing protein [Bacteroidales bacterium]
MRKKILFLCILTSLMVCCFPATSNAVPAYPFPITVKQPDGTTITVRLHGDEFLHWTTCGNNLVTRASDGYYYYATFNAAGISVKGAKKVSGAVSSSSDGSNIIPPASAVQNAMNMRKQIYTKNLEMNKMTISTKSGLPSYTTSSASSITQGTKKFLVLLIQFTDLQFVESDPLSAFDNLMNQSGYSVNGATGSVKQYYTENSSSAFNPVFTVVGPLTLSHGYAYYGESSGNSNDLRPQQMVAEACQLADAAGVNFADYDNDGDGEVDNIYCYYAGPSEAEGASSDHIWPHAWHHNSYALQLDGVYVNRYACSNEIKGISGSTMTGIGTFCHEFGHVLGLPDFYDTNYATDGYATALGLSYFSLMSSGNYLNNGNTPPYLTAVERSMLGWMNLTTLSASGIYTLEPVQNNKAYTTPTTTSGEYYVYENRQNTGWDTYIPGHGMFIYHVDKSGNDAGGVTALSRWSSNDINAYPAHQCCDLVESVGESAINSSSRSSLAQIPFPGTTGKTEFSASTTPAAKDWAGNYTGYNLSAISESGDNVNFTLAMGPTTVLGARGYNAMADAKKSYSPGDTFTLSLIKSSVTPSSVVWYFDGETKNAGDEITLTAGSHVVKAVLTYSDGAVETLIQEVVAK